MRKAVTLLTPQEKKPMKLSSAEQTEGKLENVDNLDDD